MIAMRATTENKHLQICGWSRPFSPRSHERPTLVHGGVSETFRSGAGAVMLFPSIPVSRYTALQNWN